MARFFIDRPVLAWVISIVIILLGAIAAGFLPIAEYPEITPPTVRVTASYPGANANVVADTVAAPITGRLRTPRARSAGRSRACLRAAGGGASTPAASSWSTPLAVILVVPMCLLSALAGIAFRGMDVNIFVQIGFVVLVGLACKNAILIVEFAKQQRELGKSRSEAVVNAAVTRLRPIVMTSACFIRMVPPYFAADAVSLVSISRSRAVFPDDTGLRTMYKSERAVRQILEVR